MLDGFHEGLAVYVVLGWLFGFQVEGSVGLQDAPGYVFKVVEVVLVEDGEELLLGKGLGFEGFVVEGAVQDEDGFGALEGFVDLWHVVDEAGEEPVDRQEGQGADYAAGDGVVIADDGVLDGVGEAEEDDEVKGVELG